MLSEGGDSWLREQQIDTVSAKPPFLLGTPSSDSILFAIRAFVQSVSRWWSSNSTCASSKSAAVHRLTTGKSCDDAESSRHAERACFYFHPCPFESQISGPRTRSRS